MYSFGGKTAIITGGSRGIGKAISISLGRAGANVVVNYKSSSEEAIKTVEQIKSFGSKSIPIKADVSDKNDVEMLINKSVSTFGPINILINNAGVMNSIPFLEISVNKWDYILGTNLRGSFLVGQYVAKNMIENNIQGKIVNISSIRSKKAAINFTPYSVSKAGVSMLTKQMALELAEHLINVNEVNPGTIETDANREKLKDRSFRESKLNLIPISRIGKTEDIVGAVLFLCSNEASYITGASIFIDGGIMVW